MSDIAAGELVIVRDEEWLVRAVRTTAHDETRLEVSGVSELVRDQNAVFYDSLDHIERIDPRAVEPVFDETPAFRQSRLWLESVLRRSPIPVSDPRIAVGHRALLDRMDYQLRPAEQALGNLRPRILIGDAVGLGKTLEIGILLAELIRRGRGERILVVTPRAVLEQFQHELWTRFAIPLIRLDSAGIQKVRRTLPALRNPFSYYKRAIVSVDTLKNPVHYRHHLRQHRWDAVVIDECHNLINRGTQNNALAHLLADQADALILASATPHNGKPESFAELVNLLDPTAIADTKNYTADDIAHLYVRRHRNSPDVGPEVAHNWKQRAEPLIRQVDPTPAEHAVLRELNDTWLHPRGGYTVVDKNHRLFPWTLFKAFLSSPRALRASIGRRLDAPSLHSDEERKALHRLDEMAQSAEGAPAKLAALRDHLHRIGVGPQNDTRVVIFSERIDTLNWLAGELTPALRLPAAAVAVLHASLPDETVQSVVEGFGQASSPIRVLLASDMASEGLNLHQACHQLVHYDLPWSFIRIQQRNGRIDRYGQLVEPQITALALTSTDPQIATDLRVVTKLLQKEHAANLALGDAGVLLDLHDATIEEETVMSALGQGRDLDDVVRAPEPAALNPFAALMVTGGEHRSDPPPEVAPTRTLFDDDDNFLAEALADVAAEVGADSLDITREARDDLIAFVPPADLLPRFRDLPADYLAERRVTGRLRLSGSVAFAEQRLAKARRETDSTWPDVHFLGPIHPVLDWAADRALSRFGRTEVPVLVGDLAEPTFLTQAVWSNRLGQPAIGHFGAVTGLPDAPLVGDLLDAIQAAGIRERAVNPGGAGVDLGPLKALLERVIPRTNYQRACDRDRYDAGLDQWHGRPFTDYWRLAWRRMTQSGLERSLHAALIPPGTAHVNTVHTCTATPAATSHDGAAKSGVEVGCYRNTALVAGLWSSLPYDYLVKISGRSDVQTEFIDRFPAPLDHSAAPYLLLRTLRLNCLTRDYAPFWEQLYEAGFGSDEWTPPFADWPALGGAEREWSMDTPLRTDYERRAALVEIAALAALMFRAQFPVLCKYEYEMYFDNLGRKIAKDHHAQGVRQQKDDYRMLQAYLGGEDCGDLLDRYEPHPDGATDPSKGFVRPDREAEMRAAYAEFARRLAI